MMKMILRANTTSQRTRFLKEGVIYSVLKALLATARSKRTLLLLAWSLALAVCFTVPVQGQTPDAQEGLISGTVVDSTSGDPLPGVNVYIVATQQGTATDVEGNYTITGVEPGAYDLQVSFVGYTTQLVEGVEVRAGETTEVNFVIMEEAVALDEVVAIGYGTARRSDLTGAVTSIDQEELTEVPTTNVLESLQGEVPGMDITNESGETAAGLNFTIRGNRSLTASNSPLFIVDGVQYSSIQNLNPNDVASIEVLKDAASTAIYGARGANGVVLISTKEGVSAGTQVSVSSYVGVTEPTGFPAFNSAEEYVEQKREANRTTGEWSSPEDDPNIFTNTELENYRNGRTADYRELLLQNGIEQNHQIGISTGSENTQAYMSLGAFDEQGIISMDHLRRYAFRLNLSHQINSTIEVGTNTQLAYSDQDRRANPLNIANKITPLSPVYDEEGNLITFPNNGRDISPLADEQPNAYENNTKSTDLAPKLYLELTPFEGFTFRSDVGIGLDYFRQGIYRSSATIDRNGQAPEARYLTSNNRSIDFENVLTYDTDVGAHALTLTGVFSYLGSRMDYGSELGRGQLLSSQLYYGLGNAPEGIAVESGYEETGLLSYAGRVNYSWHNRYLLTVTGRFDGSSRLSEGNKWAFFPSVAGAWRISEESFLADNALFSDLKLRMSYGVSGNDAVAPYATQATLTRIPFSYGEEAAPGYAFSEQIGNPDLKWELSSTVNLGLDVGLWGNRLYATIDLYNTRTSDLLLGRFLPETSGASRVVQNVGETQNRGVELSLSSRNIVTEDVLWRTDLTFFANQEEIVQLTGEGDDVANGWFIGQPTAVFYDYEKIGIWQESEADQAASFGQEPGEIKVRDQDGDGEITPDDRVVLGSPRPDWSGSIENTLNYKSFDVSALIFARVGQMMQYEYYNSYKPQGIENGAAVDYWTPENPTNAFPRPNARFSNENYQYYSAITYEDATFVKLRSITLGYTLPQRMANALSIDNMRIYLKGKNLLTLSGVEDYDPERGGGLSWPMTRAFVGGIDIGF